MNIFRQKYLSKFKYPNIFYCCLTIQYVILEGTAAYGRLLLDPVEGWWPSATWRALQALFSIRCLEGLLPIIFIWVVVVPDVVARSVLKLQRSYIPLWIQENLSYSLVYAIVV